jgi:hypothetical protein
MPIYKALKLEVLVLVEAEMTDAEVIKWTQDALYDYCNFDNSMVKVTERHESIMLDPNCEAEA